MLSFFKKDGFKSICEGVVGSLIANFITEKLAGNKMNIESANEAILRVLKSYMVENKVPEKEIMDAVIGFNVKKYKVRRGQLYSAREIYEKLMHEIKGDIYIPTERKNEYLQELNESQMKISNDSEDEDSQTSKMIKGLKYKVLFLEKIVLVLFFSVIVCLAGSCWEKIRYNYAKEEQLNLPVVDESLTTGASIIEDIILPDVEEFSIGDEKIFLAPGEIKKLDIRPSPPNANMESLEYESTNDEYVTVENGYITASKEVPLGNVCVDITITAGECSGKVHVTIENPPIPENTEQARGSGEYRE